MVVMHSKSGLVPSIIVIPLLSKIIHALLDLSLVLLPSDINIIGCFSWMKVNNESTAMFSLNFEINYCFQHGNVLIYYLKVISLDGTLMHIWNSESIFPFPSTIVIGMQS